MKNEDNLSQKGKLSIEKHNCWVSQVLILRVFFILFQKCGRMEAFILKIKCLVEVILLTCMNITRVVVLQQTTII